MHEILELLNDRSAGDFAELDDDELKRFEALCENWPRLAEAERARRKSLPSELPVPSERPDIVQPRATRLSKIHRRALRAKMRKLVLPECMGLFQYPCTTQHPKCATSPLQYP